MHHSEDPERDGSDWNDPLGDIGQAQPIQDAAKANRQVDR